MCLLCIQKTEIKINNKTQPLAFYFTTRILYACENSAPLQNSHAYRRVTIVKRNTLIYFDSQFYFSAYFFLFSSPSFSFLFIPIHTCVNKIVCLFLSWQNFIIEKCVKENFQTKNKGMLYVVFWNVYVRFRPEIPANKNLNFGLNFTFMHQILYERRRAKIKQDESLNGCDF